MGRSVMSVSLLVLVCLVGSAAAQSAENVNAYKVYYMAEQYDWDMNAAHVYCADVNGSNSYEWRSKYYWTGFGDPNGPSGKAACGLCVNVTNTATGDQATVRIVATSNSGLDLDEPIFHKLDSDGQGEVRGHLVVDYKFVDCDPEPAGPSESNVTAYETDYAPIANNWTYPSHAACYAKDGGKPFEWRSKYGWTGYCGKEGTDPEHICGKCLKVTNKAPANVSEVTVRIMDTCGLGALELDLETGFKPIDPDRQGIHDGHLTVDYEFVNCGDELDSPLVYSQ
ncbi:HEVEIN-LIKE, pathogenesis-related 4 [Hibiscus trionum]|uniref:HEVEIN-LIKE, pathogenesis-related 4 n=1 Tax=Hibiscus trionum TaxID=183268 RepID=A0A9W7GVG4_HIBTR|nr:HEVEIN-LIKE, pathogenesis-related 4 [Hibiscus trionum]